MAKKSSRKIIPPEVQHSEELNVFYKILFEPEPDRTDEQRLTDYVWARDKLIVWSLRRPVVEIDVTKSLISAKIRGIQFKLGQCDGVDLHEECNLALVSFINLLSEQSVLNTDDPNERRTMRDVTRSANLPTWLAYYRNMICHRLVGNPSLTILQPYIDRFLHHMSANYWSLVLKQESFDAALCQSHVMKIAASPRSSSTLNKPISAVKKKALIARIKRLSTMLKQHRRDTVRVVVEYLIRFSPKETVKNLLPIVKAVLMTSSFECFVDHLMSRIENNTEHRNHALAWLSRTIGVIGSVKKSDKLEAIKKLGVKPNNAMLENCHLSPLKCTHLAFRLTQIESSHVKRLLIKMKRKLARVMGKDRTLTLIELTRLAQRLSFCS